MEENSEVSPEETQTAAPEETLSAQTEEVPHPEPQVDETRIEVPEETQQAAPKKRGRPKGSTKVRTTKPVTIAPQAAPAPAPAPPPDIFEIIRQRQMAQHERRQAFYASFLPV